MHLGHREGLDEEILSNLFLRPLTATPSSGGGLLVLVQVTAPVVVRARTTMTYDTTIKQR